MVSRVDRVGSTDVGAGWGDAEVAGGAAVVGTGVEVVGGTGGGGGSYAEAAPGWLLPDFCAIVGTANITLSHDGT